MSNTDCYIMGLWKKERNTHMEEPEKVEEEVKRERRP